MSTSRRSPWSWTALALWLGQSLIAIAVASSMLFGPELADRAWDAGVHVTPAQAAMHTALIAAGLSHHHGHSARTSEQSSGSRDQALIESDGAAPDWGTPFTQAVPALPTCCLALIAGGLSFDRSLQPVSFDLAPPVPPPQAA